MRETLLSHKRITGLRETSRHRLVLVCMPNTLIMGHYSLWELRDLLVRAVTYKMSTVHQFFSLSSNTIGIREIKSLLVKPKGTNVRTEVFTLASHMSDFFGPGLLESALAPSAGLCERIRLLIWMPPSSSSACSFCPEMSPLLAPWGSGECRTSVQKRVRGPWSSQKWQRATIAFILRTQHMRQGSCRQGRKHIISTQQILKHLLRLIHKSPALYPSRNGWP